MSNKDVVAQIKSIRVYPIKSCRPILIESAVATPIGLPYDRHWVIVRESNNSYLTQRVFSKIATIVPVLPPDVFLGKVPGPEDCLIIQLQVHPGHHNLIRVPLMHTNQASRKIKVLEWEGGALDEGDEVASALSDFLGTAVRLCRIFPQSAPHFQLPEAETTRNVDPAFADGHQTTFTDGFPYLFVNEASFEYVLRHLEERININRFRPNILVDGMNAWEEDLWREVKILKPGTEQGYGHRNGQCTDGISFTFVKPCQRCVMTCIEQETGTRGREPLETLKIIRSGKSTGFSQYLAETHGHAFFGWNATCSESKIISIGDFIVVEKHGRWTSGQLWTDYMVSSWRWFIGSA